MTSPSRLDRLLADRPAELADAIAASRMVFRVAHLLEARVDAALAPFELSMREYLALVLIADDAVEPLRPSDLSTTLDATRVQVTRLLDGLERKALVQRSPAKEDRRALQLALTKAGSRRLKEIAPAVHAAYQEGWSAVGPKATATALKVLRTVHAGLLPEEAP
ncbi:MarR family winged helix-turn-helix transcriptional regulator [Xylophilus sp. GOD-11R]|uniref:MarR family winged helix-turn-helix transcriptional regulator n=1 Tax=Xylophilus sp. GOD-11R TaxID=3089814 RepID=UPI00298D5299|nr:MarR family transcriptional regulator [Xylophilus sp. GOD-11R]WPB58585.1 MarR family transcriptional regulator [Xylophilus sp. GOD-11R]